MLYALLKNQPKTRIWCLVRNDPTFTTPLQRIQKSLEKYQKWDEAFQTKILPVTGDLALPYLGNIAL